MQSENNFFEDFAKMANGFAGTMAGMGREAETSAREKVKQWLGGLDFVGREEFEAVKMMAINASNEIVALKAQLAAIQGASQDRGAAPTSYDTPPSGPVGS